MDAEKGMSMLWSRIMLEATSNWSWLHKPESSIKKNYNLHVLLKKMTLCGPLQIRADGTTLCYRAEDLFTIIAANVCLKCQNKYLVTYLEPSCHSVWLNTSVTKGRHSIILPAVDGRGHSLNGFVWTAGGLHRKSVSLVGIVGSGRLRFACAW